MYSPYIDSFSNHDDVACCDDASDTDADSLLVTVASSMFDLPEHSDIRNMQYVCVECNLNFCHLEELTNHQAMHHPESVRISQAPDESGDNPYHCDICKKSFADVKRLRRHMKIHSDIKPYVCNVCNASFVESSNLTKHKKRHTGELRNKVGKPNLCSVCGKYFINCLMFVD